VPCLVVHFHLDQHIAREKLAFTTTFLTLAHFDHLFGRYEDLTKLVLQPHALNALFERAFDAMLEIRVGVHDVPA
jgi:hypothetical protein